MIAYLKHLFAESSEGRASERVFWFLSGAAIFLAGVIHSFLIAAANAPELPLFEIFVNDGHFPKVLRGLPFGAYFACSMAVWALPRMFFLTFRQYPFESIVSYRKLGAQGKGRAEESKVRPVEDDLARPSSMALSVETEEDVGKAVHSRAQRYLEGLAIESKEISSLLLHRSGVYLLVGSIVALAGIGFFIFYEGKGLPPNPDFLSIALALLPKLGPFFFIELIAFFFLKQHSQMMQEFRYFDALKRNRESAVVLASLMQDKDLDIQEINLLIDSGVLETRLDDYSLRPVDGKNAAGKTLAKDELALLKAITDVVGKSVK